MLPINQRLPGAGVNFVEPARPLRILEIGGDGLFALAVPAQTEFYWTGIRLRGNVHRAFSPIRFIKSLAKLRRREYDLLAIHAAQFAPWHPRAFLTTLRDWNL